ncbi:P-loop containing nucleoside triphosphate hydrolase protein [Rhizoclosmatium globosum]|uniref:RNA helicase n=1 Tax=Rhizoclosmatium globosum TaxID=329046 RepID=A0A1Y2CF32_9FUNG|nr:P-loop containing nucleoside triphosphate hydrolase protein [Rhizoclosmatium globosum]|eukprot:ORY45661.1 P-loop containing nucleoside triphosphate hydrolase protein [Rhizoclosmatium globosum]
MSATLNSDKFSDFFGDCPVFTVPGRMYPVDLLYARKTKMASLKSQLITKSVEAVVQIHKTQPPGDILVFLTGQQEIETTCRLIREECDALGNLAREIEYYPQVKDISLHPIYSALDTPDQKDAFRPARRNTRKVVVATNIAQTSVTIPGIRYVVDSGFVKEKMFDASTGVDALLVVPISKAAATQRAGRSGRTAPGKVFRLYSRDAFEEMAEDTTPEIQRSSLISTVLALKRMGINDILNFEFIDPPDRDLLITAMKQLYYIDALDETGNLTPLGKTISTLPLPPFLSRALLAACETYNCSTELLTLCAILSSEEIMHHPRQDHKRALAEAAHAKFGHGSGDHVSLIRMYNAWIRSGESEEWCRTRFMKGRSLRAVKNVRGQLEDAVRGLGYVPVSCRRMRKKGSEEKERRRRVEEERRRDEREMVYGHDDGYGFEEDELDDFDAHAILKSLHFYHYLAASGNSTAGTSVQTGNSGALLSLHIQPSSCLAGPSSNATGINDAISANIEWVVYHDVQFVNRANMRIVSRIDFSWVEKGISRVGQCDVRKLVGLPPEVVEVTSDNVKVGKRKRSVDETKEIKDEERVVDAVVDVEAVKMKEQKEREDKAEAARQRYLSRHNKRK